MKALSNMAIGHHLASELVPGSLIVPTQFSHHASEVASVFSINASMQIDTLNYILKAQQTASTKLRE